MGKIKGKGTRTFNIKIVYLICAATILVALSVFNLALYFSNGKREVNTQALGSEKTTAEEIYYWKGLLKANPEYLEGWLELAKIQFAQGNYKEAEISLSKAQKIDPNSNEVKSLRRELGL